MSGTTESGDEHFVVLVDEVEAAIVGHEGSNLLSVLDQLNTSALTNGRVRLLGLDTAASSETDGGSATDQVRTGFFVPKRSGSFPRYESHIFSNTIPLACEEPAKGFFHSLPRWLFL